MNDFFRHTITENEILEKKFFFTGKEKEIITENFKSFFLDTFTLLINDVSWGRGRFTEIDDNLIMELDVSFFKGRVKDSTIELEIVDGTTLELKCFPPVDEYIDNLESDNDDDIIRAIRKIGETRNEKGIQPLINKISINKKSIRVEIVRALAKYEPRKEIEPIFIKLLGDADENVRSRTCDALVKYTGEKAVNALIEATKDESTTVNWAARLALREQNVEGYNTAELEI